MMMYSSYSWNEVVEVMTKIENEIYGNYSLEENEYRSFGEWVIRKQSWPVQVLKNIKNIPGLGHCPALSSRFRTKLIKYRDWGGVAGPVAGWFLSNTGKAPLRADAIMIRSRIIAFYDSYVVKTYISKNTSTANNVSDLSNEVKTISWLNNNIQLNDTNVCVPCLLIDGLDYKYPYYTQNLIYGKTLSSTLNRIKYKIGKPSQYLDTLRQVLDFCWKIYHTYGIECKSLHEVYPLLGHFPNLLENEKLNSLDNGAKKKIIKIFKKCRPLIEDNRILPCSLVHGDLGFGNIILDHNKKNIWLIDWGSSNIKPIIEDQHNLISLSNENSQYLQLVLKYMKNFTNKEYYSLQEQRLFRSLRRLYKFLNIFLHYQWTKKEIKFNKRSLYLQILECEKMIDKVNLNTVNKNELLHNNT